MAIDMELRKAFAELQRKMVETQAQMRISDIQIESLNRDKRKLAITKQEIESFPEDTKLYESVGRMFMLQPRETVKENLDSKHKQADEKINELKAKKTYLERSVKSSEENLREMVSQRRK
uniref:Prefoldin subunit 1 n=1 Tax=Phallusia mammillata TaxID=59560 RepID=A0A6F9DMZ2_9ASCI|nr:prefoldin subunit 1-like [Phallusia mammillata]